MTSQYYIMPIVDSAIDVTQDFDNFVVWSCRRQAPLVYGNTGFVLNFLTQRPGFDFDQDWVGSVEKALQTGSSARREGTWSSYLYLGGHDRYLPRGKLTSLCAMVFSDADMDLGVLEALTVSPQEMVATLHPSCELLT